MHDGWLEQAKRVAYRHVAYRYRTRRHGRQRAKDAASEAVFELFDVINGLLPACRMDLVFANGSRLIQSKS